LDDAKGGDESDGKGATRPDGGATARRGRRTPVNGSLLVMLAVVAALVAVAALRGGTPLVREGLGRGGGLLIDFGLLLVVSFLAAGLAQVLIPRGWFEGALGVGSGLRGLAIGTGAGAITPAGPFVSMPIAAVMLRSGAAPGPVVAYLTAWSLLSLNRFVAWEIPILGLRFALLRWAICLVLPMLAGLLTRALAGR